MKRTDKNVSFNGKGDDWETVPGWGGSLDQYCRLTDKQTASWGRNLDSTKIFGHEHSYAYVQTWAKSLAY